VPKITKRFVDGLKATGDVVHWDDDLTGFGVRVRSGGGKSYIFLYRLAGRPADVLHKPLGR